MEKHALNKAFDNWLTLKKPESDLPCLKLIGTFKDISNLYFLTELLKEKNEVWNSCRTFGFISDIQSKYVFY